MHIVPGSAKDAGSLACVPVLSHDIVLNFNVLAVANVEFVFGNGLGQAGGSDEVLTDLHEKLTFPLINQVIMTGPGLPMGDAPDHGIQPAS